MKKQAVMIAALVFFLLVPMAKIHAMPLDPKPTGSITVTSPNGGEVYKAGQEITVAWTSQGLPSTATVLIRLSQNSPTGASEWIGEIAGFPASRGQEPYVTIPSNITAGDNYIIGVYAIDPSLGGEVADNSDTNFTITSASQSSVTLTPVSVKANTSTTVVHTQPAASNNSNITTTSTTSATVPMQNTSVTVSFWQSIKNFFLNIF